MKKINTLIERLSILFSFFVIVLMVLVFNEYGIWAALLIPYVLPLLAFRVFNIFYPLKEGGHALISKKGICPWTVSFNLQRIYFILPSLERALMAIPGVFSFWLRLWGSKVGKNVNWINTTVTDRTGLIIGDNVFFGNQCYLSAHVAGLKNNRLILYFKKISVESNCFVGAFSMFGPGAKVPMNSQIPFKSEIYLNETYGEKKT